MASHRHRAFPLDCDKLAEAARADAPTVLLATHLSAPIPL
jgi:hypothetical protein